MSVWLVHGSFSCDTWTWSSIFGQRAFFKHISNSFLPGKGLNTVHIQVRDKVSLTDDCDDHLGIKTTHHEMACDQKPDALRGSVCQRSQKSTANYTVWLLQMTGLGPTKNVFKDTLLLKYSDLVACLKHCRASHFKTKAKKQSKTKTNQTNKQNEQLNKKMSSLLCTTLLTIVLHLMQLFFGVHIRYIL